MIEVCQSNSTDLVHDMNTYYIQIHERATRFMLIEAESVEAAHDTAYRLIDEGYAYLEDFESGGDGWEFEEITKHEDELPVHWKQNLEINAQAFSSLPD